MEFIRTLLIAFVIFISYTLYESWNKEHALTQEKTVSQYTVEHKNSDSSNDVPEINSPSNKLENSNSQEYENSNDFITVKTNVLDIKIDKIGGNIVGADLFKYHKSLKSEEPLALLSDSLKDLYIAPNGLTSKYGPDSTSNRAVYYSSSDDYDFKNSDKESYNVNLIWKNKDKNLEVTKTYKFYKDSYVIDVEYNIFNQMPDSWEGYVFSVLKQKYNPQKSTGFLGFTPFQGIAYYDQDKSYQKIAFSNISSAKKTEWSSDSGWMAMVQHYFLTAWIPPKSEIFNYRVADLGNDVYNITMWGPKITVAPNQNFNTSLKLYVGPENVDTLSSIAPGLERTVDYGILWPISSLIFKVMDLIHDYIGNWGWAIVLVTVLIKLLFYKLSAKSYRSMARMKNLAPKINALKEKYGEDKQKMGQAMMELYKKEKVNPLGGCLPMIVQIPFFIALYWVIMESVQLRQAPFIFWIHDLSSYDPYFILPIIMGGTMLLQQRLSPPPADPAQAKVMMFVPVVFTGLFLYLPSGLTLYWSVSNALSILQQWYVMKTERSNASNKKNKNTKNKKVLDLKKISVNKLNNKELRSE